MPYFASIQAIVFTILLRYMEVCSKNRVEEILGSRSIRDKIIRTLEWLVKLDANTKQELISQEKLYCIVRRNSLLNLLDSAKFIKHVQCTVVELSRNVIDEIIKLDGLKNRLLEEFS